MRDVDTETMNLSDDLRVEEPMLIDADALTAAAAVLFDAQHGGGFVSSFEMTPRDVAISLALTQTQLTQLRAECDPRDDVGHGWRRVRGKKGSSVRLWERGRASALTRTGVDRKFSRVLRRRKASTADALDNEYPTSQRGHYTSTPEPTDTAALPEKETYAVRSSMTVHAPLASVMKTLDCSTATSYRSFTKIMYENLVADTSVLSHQRVASSSPAPHDPPSHLAESVALRWVVCKCTSPLVSDCDLSLVEYSKVHSIDDFIAAGDAPTNNQEEHDDDDDDNRTQGSDGLRVREKLPAAYKVFRSMETRHCPVLSDAPHHLERVHIPLGGFLLYPTDNDNVTDVVFFMSATYERKKTSAGLGPTTFLTSDDRQFRAIQHVLHRMALGIGRIANAVDAYTMSLQLETLRLTKWIENSDRSECVVCFHRFHPITRRRHHCRMCGDVICRDCSIHKDADLPTIGPTTLRICKLCDVQHFGRSSVLASIATDVKRTGLTAFQQREIALETTTFESPTGLGLRQRFRRQTDMSMEASKSSSKQSGGGVSVLESPKASIARQQHRDRRLSIDQQPVSCPKPTLTLAPPRGLAERWASRHRPAAVVAARSPTPSLASPHTKWSKAFFANRAAAVGSQRGASPLPRPSARSPTARSTTPLQSPVARFARSMPVPGSATKETQHGQRFNFSLMKLATGPTPPPPTRPRQLSSGDISLDLDSPASQWKTTPTNYASTPPKKKLTRGSSLYSHDGPKASTSESENQSVESERRSSLRDSLSLGRRARLDHIDQYEDLLRDLCERASDATDAKYAAISLFTSQNPAKSTSNNSALTMVHFLKVRESTKLMKIAPNMRCCEPILTLGRSVVTRNALTCKLDGAYDMATLPVVKGPQQARFYGGVPLVDAQQRLVGALAVFDAQLVDDDDEILECPRLLASLAHATMNHIEARRSHKALETFMNAPLLRQTEPTAAAWRGYGNNAEEDGGGDYGEEDEEHVRAMHGTHTTVATSSSSSYVSHGPIGSSSKSNALNYYKQQMHRLVEQANQTQDTVLQNSFKMHGVSH